MDAITVFTENYYPLHKRWLNTLPIGFNPLTFKFETKETVFGFRSKSWYEVIKFKIETILKILKSKPDNEIILVSDSDIFFIKKDDTFIKLANKIFTEDKNLDLWIMQENKEYIVNTGLFFIRNSHKIRTFLDDNIKNYGEHLEFADQSFFNNNLNLLNFKFIPNKYVIWATVIFDSKSSIFHHAVFTGNVKEKLHQQNLVIEKFNIDITNLYYSNN